MNIFIFGSGFLGSKLAAHFKSKGNLVTVTTTSPSKVEALKDVASQVVLLDSSTDLKKCLTHQETLIVCTAPKSGQGYREAYLETAEQLKNALKENTYVKHLIYTSSCSVYGEKSGDWVDENQSLEPVNSNQQILVDAEKIYLNQISSSIKVTVFRLGEIYGLEKSMESKIMRLCDSKMPVNGSHYTNLIHVQDVVKAFDFSTLKQMPGVFNLCNDSHLTRKELYQKWCAFLKINPPQFDPHYKSAHRGNKRVSNQKIKLHGFQFMHPVTNP